MNDVLDILRTLRLTGSVFLDAEFTAPWCVMSKIGPEDCGASQPPPRSIIAYHYVSAGRMNLQVGGAAPLAVEAGEVVVLPRNDAHTLGSDLSLVPVNAGSLIEQGAAGQLDRIRQGDGGPATRIFCGFLGSDTTNHPVIAMLPPVLKLDVAQGVTGSWIESSLRFAAEELGAASGQSAALLGKLAELIFMEAVRRYLASLPKEQRRWAEGLGDAAVGRAIGLLHNRLNNPWTAEDLAREVGMSRSAFAERFTRVMGESPMHYLGVQRLEAASRRLHDSQEAVSRIAFEVGYDSEAAFSRAFKRHFGQPPATWRRQATKPIKM